MVVSLTVLVIMFILVLVVVVMVVVVFVAKVLVSAGAVINMTVALLVIDTWADVMIE